LVSKFERMSDSPQSEPLEAVPARREPSDRDLLVDLVQRFHRPLFAYGYRLTGNAADAEDVVQQTVLVAQQKISQLRDPHAAQGWLFRVLRNCFLKNLRKRRPLSAADVELDMDLVAGDLPEDEPIDSEQLQAALNELPGNYRIIIVMFFFEELSYKQIAAELDIPVGTVMSRLSRAKDHLRRRLMALKVP